MAGEALVDIVVPADGGDPEHAPGIEDGHLGLTVMRERARGYGGDCEVASTPGHGTTVRLWIPL